MICASCGIEWEGLTVTPLCPRCQGRPGLRSELADEPPMPAAELQALMVQLKQIGWTPKES